MRSNDDVREYLMRWLLEFGDGPVHYTIYQDNAWYRDTSTEGWFAHPDYFSRKSKGAVVINKRGFALLKGDSIEKT